ncbi:hypothetical protein D9599_19515 [Roseomonas sp. KE2513]|uniref:tyrosine-type recombinase/integrase n=1 Tax=Roseomonas sp. KE2513 TaxID=2479202 RepID=UPI0018E04DD5|nr:tyrosine-type recombinase/integrase [Roseomonas sp. KE2513]MBI0537752.1 hypothetical protein [Roseomonas sp. KE2513]
MLATRPSPATPLGARDRALLLAGFGAALRRSELAGLRLGDVTPVPGRGLRVLVRRSKIDQRGASQEVAVWANPGEPGFCPLAALEGWLAFRQKGPDITGGASDRERPLFVGMSKAGRLTGQELSEKAVARLAKGAAKAAGLEGWEHFSGHSLRAGLARPVPTSPRSCARPVTARPMSRSATSAPPTSGATTPPRAFGAKRIQRGSDHRHSGSRQSGTRLPAQIDSPTEAALPPWTLVAWAWTLVAE